MDKPDDRERSRQAARLIHDKTATQGCIQLQGVAAAVPPIRTKARRFITRRARRMRTSSPGSPREGAQTTERRPGASGTTRGRSTTTNRADWWLATTPTTSTCPRRQVDGARRTHIARTAHSSPLGSSGQNAVAPIDQADLCGWGRSVERDVDESTRSRRRWALAVINDLWRWNGCRRP